jgi:gentisate 1,2-dioxygenase
LGFQIVMPGESAEAHRHSPSALRFVVQGQGAYTTSNGEPMIMAPGDLLTQPNWVWHDHTNNTADPIIWIDSLDAGLVRLLDARFFEKWRDGRVQPLTRPYGFSTHRYGTLRQPDDEHWAAPFHYPWQDTHVNLQLMAQDRRNDPHDGIVLEYRNPVTGGHTLRNATCYIQMLRPGEVTKAHRHTGMWIYHVYDGSGVTMVGSGKEVELAWQNKDVFVVPSWAWHWHENRSDKPAYLFSVSDRPIVEAAGLYREESREDINQA